LLGLLFDPENGGSMFFQNIDELLLDYTEPHSRRQQHSLYWVQQKVLDILNLTQIYNGERRGTAVGHHTEM
jgi:hypothetical protein